MTRDLRIRSALAGLIALAALGACRPRSEPAPGLGRPGLTIGFDGGSLIVERGECEDVDAAQIRAWADRAFADLSEVWPDRAFRASGLRMLGQSEPRVGGAPVFGYWDRERSTVVFRCGVEQVIRHELFHVYCERAALPCDCTRIDHPGGFDLACRPAGD